MCLLRILLSGGMDSSAIAASADKFSSNVKLISAVSDDDPLMNHTT